MPFHQYYQTDDHPDSSDPGQDSEQGSPQLSAPPLPLNIGFERLALAPAPRRSLVEHFEDMHRQAQSAAGLQVGTHTCLNSPNE
jgi:hypothetical protein